MSELRKHLQLARQQYRQAKYPGDLAADVLKPRSAARWFWSTAALVAAAAMLILVIRLRNFTEVTEFAGGTDTIEQEQPEVLVASWPALSVPAPPEEVTTVAPPALDLSFSAPSFSLASEPDTDDSSTTQEAV